MIGFRHNTGVALRDLVESQGIGAATVIREALSGGKLKPEQFSLREIWEATERNPDGSVRNIHEAVSSDMFPIITGEIISSKIIGAYQIAAVVGDKLCTTVPSSMEIETFGGFDEVEMPEEVQQGRDYNESDMGEKYAQIPHTKYGRILSVTEEMIYFDKTGQILMRASRLGQKAALYREKLIIEGVQDVNSNVFRPSGIATAMYRSTASGDRKINLKATNPFGEAGLKAVFKLMHNMVDEQGDYVMINTANLMLLVPFDLNMEALQMQNSTYVPEGNENAVNTWKGAFTPLTSPYVTAQSTTTWYIGDFKEDFIWSEVWPLQTFSAKPGNDREFRADIKSQHKVRFFGQIGSVDDKHSYKCTAT